MINIRVGVKIYAPALFHCVLWFASMTTDAYASCSIGVYFASILSWLGSLGPSKATLCILIRKGDETLFPTRPGSVSFVELDQPYL